MLSRRYISSSIGCDNIEAQCIEWTGDGGTFVVGGDLEVDVKWADV
jgi:hypothetical protein